MADKISDFSQDDIVIALDKDSAYPHKLRGVISCKSYKNDGILIFGGFCAGTCTVRPCYKYMVKTKKYIKLCSPPRPLYGCNLAITGDNKYVFIGGIAGILEKPIYFLYDEDLNKWTDLNELIDINEQKNVYHYGAICFDEINNNLHIIHKKDHFMVDWDSKLKIMQKLPNTLKNIGDDNLNMEYPSMCYNKCQEKIYLFGGKQHKMYTYSCIKDGDTQWIELSEKSNLPKKLNKFGHIIVNDDKQMIVIGGIEWGLFDAVNTIFIFHFPTLKWMKSKKILPLKIGYIAPVLFNNTIHSFAGYDDGDITKYGGCDQHLIIKTRQQKEMEEEEIKKSKMRLEKQKQIKQRKQKIELTISVSITAVCIAYIVYKIGGKFKLF